MNRFEDDKEIVGYIKKSIENMQYLEEYRLYKEEQIQGDMKLVLKIRNSIEWIIRMNKIIRFISFSLSECLKFALLVENPIKENQIKDMYSYYLEDSVYRVMVLWDMYKQLVNEYYSVGFARRDNYSIYRLKKELKQKALWNRKDIRKLEAYINSDKHKSVRDYLRNSYTHSVDPTSTFIFHDFNETGLVEPDIHYIIPKHPYENLISIVDDLHILLEYINNVNKNIRNDVLNHLILVEPIATLRCGREEEMPIMNIEVLNENKELIGIYSESDYCMDCKYIIEYEHRNTCKPKNIRYSRIYEDEVSVIDVNTDILIYG